MDDLPRSITDHLAGHRDAAAFTRTILASQPEQALALWLALDGDERFELVAALAAQSAGYLSMLLGSEEAAVEVLDSVAVRLALKRETGGE